MADREQTDIGGEAGSGDPANLGNRPAAGARVVDNAAELPSSFGGGQEATDFLGLSQDLGGFDPGAPEVAAPIGSSSAISPGEGIAPAADDGSASWLLAPSQPIEAAEERDVETEETVETAPAENSRPRRILSLAAAVLVIGGAVTIAMKFADHSKTDESALLTANHPPAPKKIEKPFELSSPPKPGSSGREGILPNGETVPVTHEQPEVAATPAPSAETTPTEATPAPTPVEPPAPPRPGAQRLAEWMRKHGWSPPAAPAAEDVVDPSTSTNRTGWSSTALLAFATRSPLSLPSGDSVGPALPDPVSPALTSLPGEALVDASASSLNRTSGPVPAGAVRMASAEDLAGIWNSDVIPMDMLDAETRIVTPAVGSVRVVMKSGELFDGKLYAVGQGQVWLDMEIGRLALSARSVLRIDQAVSEKDTKALEALPRMRVRTPGGLFYGKVLSRDENHVTLRLEGGGRITLESTDVEPAPLGDTRVIGAEKP